MGCGTGLRRLRGQRAVVLDQPLQRLPGEVEPVEARVFPLKLGDHAQGSGRCGRSRLHRRMARVERPLPAWPKGGWPRSWASASASARSSSTRERARHGAGDLRHFEAMGEPGAVVIALVIDEDLRLVGQPAESGRMQDAVAVAG